jgi:predicted AlkP superfamily phosphohydrolase/phosphomutase
MTNPSKRKPTRRTFLKATAGTAAVAAAGGAAAYWAGGRKSAPKSIGKKVIVIGIDGMDPVLTKFMMDSTDERGRPQLPNLARLREQGGFSPLGTSIPPQSPVAWANFINGAGPGSHGIFDFIHRDPHQQCKPCNSLSEIGPGEGAWDVGDYQLPLDFWPFNHKPPTPQLRRQGVPFWDFLDAAGVPTTFYDLPSNYPPSPSQHGHHRCICGMGTPDMRGTAGVYQFFAEDCPPEGIDHGTGRQSPLRFDGETASASLLGPENGFRKAPQPVTVDFQVHRDREAKAAVIEIQGQKIILKEGAWSRWTKINFEFPLPWFVPNGSAAGICRFYLQKAGEPFRLYVSPINMDPAAPALKMSEPESFVKDVSARLGPFYTTGFQEDYNARKDDLFDDDEYLRQANEVLEERLALFHDAVDNFDDGLLFFYFSSSDLQSHMFWWEWDRSGPSFHPSRDDAAVWKNFDRIVELYKRLDQVIGEVMARFGSRATIFVMSDHGFANFGRQLNLNTWLREYGYLAPCKSIMHDVDWSATKAYGLGINGLYLNLKGRERDGVVEPGDEANRLLAELKERLEEEIDPLTNLRVVRTAYRAGEVYSGTAMALAPDLIVGYNRGYRASWETCLGDVTDSGDEEPKKYLSTNKLAWSADHCADALEVPGVLLCSRPISAAGPSLIDVAPSILAEFGLSPPASMTGKSIFS